MPGGTWVVPVDESPPWLEPAPPLVPDEAEELMPLPCPLVAPPKPAEPPVGGRLPVEPPVVLPPVVPPLEVPPPLGVPPPLEFHCRATAGHTAAGPGARARENLFQGSRIERLDAHHRSNIVGNRRQDGSRELSCLIR